MSRKFRKKLLMVQLDVETPDDAVAVLCRELTPQHMQGPTEERNVLRPTLGNFEMYHTGPHTGLNFSVEMAGSGTVGEPPVYSPLLRACGLAETIVMEADTPVGVEYTPVDTGEEAVNLFYYHDGILHELSSARGRLQFDLNPGGLPRWNFNFLGLRNAPVDEAFPSVDFSSWPVPEAVNAKNTGDFELFSYAGTASALSIDLAQQVVYRNLIGKEEIRISDRRPTGSITLEEPLLSVKDYYAIVAGHTTGAFTVRHGTPGPYSVKIDAPAVQLVQPQEGDADGLAMLQMNMRLMPVTGNDEIKITMCEEAPAE